MYGGLSFVFVLKFQASFIFIFICLRLWYCIWDTENKELNWNQIFQPKKRNLNHNICVMFTWKHLSQFSFTSE